MTPLSKSLSVQKTSAHDVTLVMMNEDWLQKFGVKQTATKKADSVRSRTVTPILASIASVFFSTSISATATNFKWDPVNSISTCACGVGDHRTVMFRKRTKN